MSSAKTHSFFYLIKFIFGYFLRDCNQVVLTIKHPTIRDIFHYEIWARDLSTKSRQRNKIDFDDADSDISFREWRRKIFWIVTPDIDPGSSDFSFIYLFVFPVVIHPWSIPAQGAGPLPSGDSGAIPNQGGRDGQVPKIAQLKPSRVPKSKNAGLLGYEKLLFA